MPVPLNCPRFMQMLFSKRVMPFNDVLEKTKDFEEVKSKGFEHFIAEINRTIAKQNFRVIFPVCEVTGEKQCALVNTDWDEEFDVHDKNEVELFYSIIREIVTSSNRRIAPIRCLNLTSSLQKSLSKDRAEKLLQSWAWNGYLVSHDGLIYLGSRCISEFHSYFNENYKDYLTVCELCDELVYHGVVCSACNTLLHKYCIEKYLKQQQCPKCPKCKDNWKEAYERVDMDTTVFSQPKPPRKQRKTK